MAALFQNCSDWAVLLTGFEPFFYDSHHHIITTGNILRREEIRYEISAGVGAWIDFWSDKKRMDGFVHVWWTDPSM